MLFLTAMKRAPICIAASILCIIIVYGCANIVPPTGGKKDTTPPKLLSVYPADSQLNIRVTEIEMKFDEFVVLSQAAKEIQVSPVIPFPVNALVNGKKVKVEIPDSLLRDNTTYRISFGKAIQDLHENNVFANYNYIFSTGDYFDTLLLNGYVLDAATGKPASDVVILIHDISDGDSAVVKKKPTYVISAGSGGTFIVPGLPARAFRVYALKDKNDNLVYDGEEEMIGFVDSVFMPVDSPVAPIELRIFKEIMPLDTLSADTVSDANTSSSKFRGKSKDKEEDKTFYYRVGVDTTDTAKRTHDITKPVKVTFSQPIDTYDIGQVFLSYDSSGIDVEAEFTFLRDTTVETFLLNTSWKPNTVYTLRLLKDFATDTFGNKTVPSKHMFRTKSEDDYGIINIQLTEEYYDPKYLMQVTIDNDTVYQQPITDTLIRLTRLKPGRYGMRIIVDENRNEKWDTGDLFAKKQPELVIPYDQDVELRAGWENLIDFQVAETEKPEMGTSPPKGDKRGRK